MKTQGIFFLKIPTFVSHAAANFLKFRMSKAEQVTVVISFAPPIQPVIINHVASGPDSVAGMIIKVVVVIKVNLTIVVVASGVVARVS